MDGQRSGHLNTSPVPRWRAGLLLALVLPVAAWVLYESQRTFRADWASVAARSRVQAWVESGGAPKDPGVWEEARSGLERSVAITPEDPDLQDRLGDLYVAAGLRDWADAPRSQAHFAMASTYYEAALARRPGEPRSWAMLALTLQLKGSVLARVHEAWARARALGPFEGHVQPVLMQIVLADWSHASPAMRDWATGLFDHGDEAMRRGINGLAAQYGLRFDPDPPAKASK